MIAALIALVLVSSCIEHRAEPEPEPEPVETCTTVDLAVLDDTLEIWDATADPGLPAQSYELTLEQPGENFEYLGVQITFSNNSETSDCVVAAYVSAEEPDPVDLPTLTPSSTPPASAPGVGTLLGAANLARVWDTVDTVTLSATLAWPGDPTHLWVTLITCDEGEVTATLQPQYGACIYPDDDVYYDLVVEPIWVAP